MAMSSRRRSSMDAIISFLSDRFTQVLRKRNKRRALHSPTVTGRRKPVAHLPGGLMRFYRLLAAAACAALATSAFAQEVVLKVHHFWPPGAMGPSTILAPW